MDKQDIKSAIEAILFASGDPMPAERIALVSGGRLAALGEISGGAFVPHDVFPQPIEGVGSGYQTARAAGEGSSPAAPVSLFL